MFQLDGGGLGRPVDSSFDWDPHPLLVPEVLLDLACPPVLGGLLFLGYHVLCPLPLLHRGKALNLSLRRLPHLVQLVLLDHLLRPNFPLRWTQISHLGNRHPAEVLNLLHLLGSLCSLHQSQLGCPGSLEVARPQHGPGSSGILSYSSIRPFACEGQRSHGSGSSIQVDGIKGSIVGIPGRVGWVQGAHRNGVPLLHLRLVGCVAVDDSHGWGVGGSRVGSHGVGPLDSVVCVRLVSNRLGSIGARAIRLGHGGVGV
mmetsp:Transcript_31419/g.49193  ORF Transcript_31419/g.49193 Transcript_31419/m.49193 type:complete len:257 (-) Transcript_31419:133-903(-)